MSFAEEHANRMGRSAPANAAANATARDRWASVFRLSDMSRRLSVNTNNQGDWEKQEMSDVEMPSGFSKDPLANLEPGSGADHPGTEKDFGRDRPRHFDLEKDQRKRPKKRYPIRGRTVKLARDVWIKKNDLYAIRNGVEEEGYIKIPRGSLGVVTAVLPGVERMGRSIQVKFGNGQEAVFTSGRGYADPRMFLRRAQQSVIKPDYIRNLISHTLTVVRDWDELLKKGEIPKEGVDKVEALLNYIRTSWVGVKELRDLPDNELVGRISDVLKWCGGVLQSAGAIAEELGLPIHVLDAAERIHQSLFAQVHTDETNKRLKENTWYKTRRRAPGRVAQTDEEQLGLDLTEEADEITIGIYIRNPQPLDKSEAQQLVDWAEEPIRKIIEEVTGFPSDRGSVEFDQVEVEEPEIDFIRLFYNTKMKPKDRTHNIEDALAEPLDTLMLEDDTSPLGEDSSMLKVWPKVVSHTLSVGSVRTAQEDEEQPELELGEPPPPTGDAVRVDVSIEVRSGMTGNEAQQMIDWAKGVLPDLIDEVSDSKAEFEKVEVIQNEAGEVINVGVEEVPIIDRILLSFNTTLPHGMEIQGATQDLQEGLEGFFFNSQEAFGIEDNGAPIKTTSTLMEVWANIEMVRPARASLKERTKEESNMGVSAMLRRRAQEDARRKEFDPEQVAMGVEVESEHTDVADLIVSLTDQLTREEIYAMIAKAHLREMPDYYTRLKKMEAEAKSGDGMEKESQVDYSSGGAFTNKFPIGHTVQVSIPSTLIGGYHAPEGKVPAIIKNNKQGPGMYMAEVPGEHTSGGQKTQVLVIDDTYAKPDRTNYPSIAGTTVAPEQAVGSVGTPY